MPLESILTSGPSDASSAAKAAKPGVRVGSPPVTTKPSSHLAWEAAKVRTEAAGRGAPLAKARDALWQCGQRRLQPPKKSTAQSLPGQSQKDMGSMPRTSSQAGESVILSSKTEWIQCENGPAAPCAAREKSPLKSPERRYLHTPARVDCKGRFMPGRTRSRQRRAMPGFSF